MKSLGQYFTTAWAAEILFDAHFSDLTEQDMVWEPTCGNGNALAAIPAHIPCIGTEIDAQLAEQARRRSGRAVITGDCRHVSLPDGITAVFGNPPFDLVVFEGLLERCARLLGLGHRAGFLLPAYFLQTSATVLRFARHWTLQHEIIPRDIFPGLSKPLVFCTFTRENRPQLVGFRLFTETAELKALPAARRELFAGKVNGPRSVWREAVKTVLEELGGTAALNSIYRAIEGRRPTENTYWKEQVRKVLQQSFNRVSEGVYALPAVA